MATIEVGIRELQRRMTDTLARIEEERCGVIVSRHGQPVAVLDRTGRIAIRAGTWWALVDLSGGSDPPRLLRIARRAELERWLTAPDLAP